ncbi:type VI secretion system Vgr family protein, partial [Desulfovibrio sp. OttesenSCG-928-M14]|nr:type VI secretion system Vgr family protein [Desulfovibrio sp. OttesenSCG-928-M14]
FRVAFVPRTARLNLAVHSRIFLNMQLPQILNKVLKEEKFTPDNDFDNCLKGTYASRPYTCQYNESPANFLRRHLERAGAYSYIRQTDKGDVLVLADESMQAEKLPIRDDLIWSEDHADETVFSLARTLSATPTKVTVRDYSTEQPGTTAKSLDDAQALYGGGEVNMYAAHNLYGDVDWASKDLIVEEANASAARLAEAGIRALKARSSRAEGESSISWLQAGYAVTIDKESFQLVSVRHACTPAADELEERMVRRARQAGFIAGTAQGYRNAFVCHPLSLCAFAPQCETPRPSISGFVHVKVDASSDGVYAELDSHGRYKVMFFFPEKIIHTDADDPSEGNRSIPLRMAQAHVGQSSGIHFPLLKGAEALVAFTDGDPDRPVILSAMPNPEHPSVVADTNQESNMIQTPGGHKINLTDTDGKRSFTMETPGGHSIRMHDENGKREIRLESNDGSYIRLHEK